MLFAAFCFSIMAVCVKFASHHYFVSEILFYRSLFSVVAIAAFAAIAKQSLKTAHWRAHLRRAACGVCSMSIWFYTLGVLPIALSVTLNYMSPLFISILAALAMLKSGRRASPLLYISVVLGFLGVLALLNPTLDRNNTGAIFLGIFGAFIAALAFRDVKTLTQLGEPEWRLVFYFSLFSSIAAAIGMIVQGSSPHHQEGILALLGAGIFGTLGQLGVSLAYGRGNPLVSASLQFSGVIFSSLWGIWFANERLSGLNVAGIILIAMAGIVSVGAKQMLYRPKHGKESVAIR
jgi:S-adenosylmethionine uptake transporter